MRQLPETRAAPMAPRATLRVPRTTPMVPRASRQLPGNLDQAIFRIGAFAFGSLSTLALVSDYVGPGQLVVYPAVWAITLLAYAGGGFSWLLARRRAPIELILPLALLGVV